MNVTLPLQTHKPKGQLPPAVSQPVRNVPAAYVPRMRVLVIIGVLLMVHFIWWFADDDHIGYAPLFWLLTVSLGFKCLKMLHEWYHYIQVSEPVAPATSGHQQYTVDMLTTACPSEPRDMIVDTLRAMQAVTYPHTSYLCDEGNDPYLRHVCAELGVVHVTRQLKVNAKAGNINHALQQATGELCVVLDPDHVPTPDFLDKVVPYFADPTVGYAQVVQAYSNQEETLVALGAAEQTYQFYGPLMMGMNTYNTAQSIGANCTFRRAALDSIGGHAAGLTEDMHTAMCLHAAGWKSVYVPAIVSRGLVPASLAAFFAQQLKWARGSFDLLFHVYPRLFTRFTWRQKLHYATLPLYFFSGVITLIDIGVPIAALIMIQFPWHLSLGEFALHMTPLLLVSLLIRYNAQRWLREPHETGLHLAGGFLRIGTWWIYCLGLLYTILGVRVPYIPTPKEGCGGNEWQLSLPNIALAALSVGAARYAHYLIQTPYALLMMALAMSNAAFLMVSVLMAQHDLLRSLKHFVNSKHWVQNMLQKVEHWLTERTGAVLPRFRTAAVYVACCLITAHAFLSVGVEFWRHHITPSASLIWAHTGEGGLRIGHNEAPSTIWSASVRSASQTASPMAPAVVELWLTPSVAPQVEPAVLEQLDAQGSLPLLSWEVKPESVGSSEWQRSVDILKQHSKPLLLRPIIRATNPAAYRAAWQQLVTSFKASGVSGPAWVWTPPRPDSVAAYFPGSAFTDWVAADYLSLTPATLAEIKKPYTSLRLQLAERAELNSKPIFMLALAQPGLNQQAQAKRLKQQYPEVKALILGSPKAQQTEVVVLNAQPGLQP
ncbi:cellulose synthase (UDP-forming) [Hymenobacter gelipurpurascens]|uniref:Cellulose synthase (UDP-forming) n=2 Tax=Hymenobacter gelipurpurascens TaxID=89968 RepID=A0A212TD94_9BACT|nr:cellulose synthase (UDP-forming) [Hymenobacter gelipurpurascens]